MFSWGSEYSPSNTMGLKMVLFHDFILIIILGVMVFITFMMFFSWKKKFIVKNYVKNQSLEFCWTLVPIGMVLVLFFPSMLILKTPYFSPEIYEQVVHVIGHQWKWEYEFFLGKKEYWHNIVASPEKSNINRLLSTSDYLLVKSKVNTLFIVSSDDVIHGFSLPEFGIKVDAVPGRENEFILSKMFSKVGVYSGQCSEICGSGHSKMPIILISVPFHMGPEEYEFFKHMIMYNRI